MFPQQPQQQFRTAGAHVQIFYGTTPTSGANNGQRTWNKPVGVSHVYMLLIGGGGTGDGTTGGGSGGVTVWYGAAQNVPDSLVVIAGSNNISSTISARFSNSAATPTGLLVGYSTVSTTGGSVQSANQFTASGFFQSVAGVDGNTGGGAQTTFLCGGDNASTTVGNYGYANKNDGFFMLQPIIVSVGGRDVYKGGIGSGGGSGNGFGGQGMVLIASW
jgi:hypothetical protein